MALVLDTSVLFASLDRDERDHSACRDLVEGSAEELVIPAPVLVELEYLISKRPALRAWVAFAEDLAGGAYRIFELDAPAVLAAARLQKRYADLRLGFVDAAIAVVCDALGEEKLATLDRRHFGVVRTARGRAFELLPST